MTQQTKEEILIKKVNELSQKYHNLSLLFYELSQSLNQEYKHGKRYKELKEILGEYDFNRLKEFEIKNLKELKGGLKDGV